MEEYKVCKVTRCSVWEISNEGHIKRNGKEYIPKEGNHGYYRTSFDLVHRLVAKAFIPNPDNKQHVDHINGNKHDNRAVNLRWVTRSENMLNPITRIHNSEAQSKIYTEEVRKERSEAKKLYYINHPELRHKLSEIAKNRKRKRGQHMTDGLTTIYVLEDYWGEYIDIGFYFKNSRIYNKQTYKNIDYTS